MAEPYRLSPADLAALSKPGQERLKKFVLEDGALQASDDILHAIGRDIAEKCGCIYNPGPIK